jgi:hypothetical protein
MGRWIKVVEVMFVWEVKIRREVEGIWLIEGIKPEEGQIFRQKPSRDPSPPFPPAGGGGGIRGLFLSL